LDSWNGPIDGFCLPYNKKVHEKQLWLKNYMWLEFYNILKNLNLLIHSFNVDTLFYSFWKCSSRMRTKAMPHIKTYCRISSCCTKMSWFLLTSANLSKSAWGRKLKSKDQSNYIMAHEAGVLFLPQFLVNVYFFYLLNILLF